MGSARRAVAPPVALLGLVVMTVLLVTAGRYGYHRDELYFLQAGRHPAWGYPDQGPLTPLIARAMDALAPGSLTVLRAPSALMAAITVVLTGALARELGGSVRAQSIAAGSMAAGALLLFDGHLLSTSTFDLMAWTAVTLLVARALRTGSGSAWIGAGAVAGLALLDKPLIAFLLAALGAALLVVGPRAALRSRGPWLGLALAALLWSPWVIWQIAHGLPQLDVSSSIASGGSASSQPPWAVVPFQFLLVSPLLAPVWIAGLVALARREELRRYRAFALAWVLLAVVFMLTGGKPYYLGGLFGVLLAAGAIEVDGWLDRPARRARAAVLGVALVAGGAVSAVISLPLLPVRDAGIVIDANADVGETVGWPDLVRSVDRVYAESGAGTVILTANYGQAGAIDRYGRALGLPAAYSGHNAFHEWGPPPDRAGPVLLVGRGFDAGRRFRGCVRAGTVGNAAGADNDEAGTPITRCSGTRRSWSALWPGLARLG